MRNTASYMAVWPASAPEWERIALVAAAVFPGLSAITGLRRVTRLTFSMKRRPSPSPSMYVRITSTPGSSPKYSM